MAYFDQENGWVKEYAIAPSLTPQWLKIEKVTSDEAPLIEIQVPPFEDRPVAGWTSTIQEMWRDRLRSKSMRWKGTGWAFREAREVLQIINVFHNDSPVGWYDMDAGFVRFATLWDLGSLKQGVSQDMELAGDEQLAQFAGKKLWLLSELQWDNAIYPPPIRGGPPFAAGATVDD